MWTRQSMHVPHWTRAFPFPLTRRSGFLPKKDATRDAEPTVPNVPLTLSPSRTLAYSARHSCVAGDVYARRDTPEKLN